MRFIAALVAVTLLAVTAALAADPSGRYTVEGTNPGNGSAYSGGVTVEKTGETYRVVWVVGDTRYVGTGIGDHNFIAVSYRSGNSSGLALYRAEGGDWQGVWTYSGGKQIGAERWLRR